LLRFDLLQFVLASIIGRGFRFFVVAALIRFAGEKLRPFIEKRLELAFVVFTFLGIAGIVAIKYLR